MSPTVPMSFFVDHEESGTVRLSEPTTQPAEDPTGCAAMSPQEVAEQIRLQLGECRPLSPAELADEQRIREEIRAAEMLDTGAAR